MRGAIVGIAATIYGIALPIAWIVLALVVFMLLPLAIFRRTREKAGLGIFFSSWVFGITTWMLGAVVTFATFGWLGLLVGLVLFGVGVVPLGIIAALFIMKETSLGLSLLGMAALVLVTRMGGMALVETASNPSRIRT